MSLYAAIAYIPTYTAYNGIYYIPTYTVYNDIAYIPTYTVYSDIAYITTYKRLSWSALLSIIHNENRKRSIMQLLVRYFYTPGRLVHPGAYLGLCLL